MNLMSSVSAFSVQINVWFELLKINSSDYLNMDSQNTKDYLNLWL